MTERRLYESAIGLAGRLSHTSYGTEKADDCGWRSSRNFTQHAPIFRELGPCTVWIPSKSDRVGEPPPSLETPSQKSRRQQTCLLKSHPEASLGNDLLHEHLLQENSPFSSYQVNSWRSCHFSFGELTNTSDPQRVHGDPMVVTVTGGANNVLRLARLEQREWRWRGETDAGVFMADNSEEDPALGVEATPGPIHRVKCIVDSTRYNPTRWLAVQRNSGTTIFRPEYRRAPITIHSHEKNPSRIAENPLFHISKEQTGGNEHTDVAFNPGTRSNPPQLGIIDERGFWSVWDITLIKARSSSKPIPKLRTCGHIEHGIMEKLPYREPSELQWHGILWVGCSDDQLSMLGTLKLSDDHDDTTEGLEPKSSFPPLQRSSLLLVYSSQKVRVLDLNTGFWLPDLEFVPQNSMDYVLDVQISPHSPEYFYVLTTSRIFLIRNYSRSGAACDKPDKTWSILFSTPHFRSSFDRSLKLVITQSASSSQGTDLVFINSTGNPWIDVFHVAYTIADPNRVQCRRNAATFSELQNMALESSIQTLWIHSLSSTGHVSRGYRGKSILRLAGLQREFYQVTALGSDGSLLSTMCMSPALHGSQIIAPRKQDPKPSKRAERERRRLVQHLASRFVVPDELEMEDESTALPNKTRSHLGGGTQYVAQRFIKPFYEMLNDQYQTRLASQGPESSGERDVFGSNPFDFAHLRIEESIESMTMSLRALIELMPRYEEAARHSLPALEWGVEIERLNHIHPTVEVFTFDLLRSSLGLSNTASFQEAHEKLLEIIDSQWDDEDIDDFYEERRRTISQQLRYDLYLSIIGIGYHKPDLDNSSGADPPGAAGGAEGAEGSLIHSQIDESLASSPPRAQSPASSSQRSNSAAVAEGEDPAMTLLRTYTGTGKFVPQKQFELLDKWQLGADPVDYAFELDRDADLGTGAARIAKQRAREERKRRRAESLLHLSQEPDLPATQPAPDTSFFSSQPTIGGDSQSRALHSDPLHTMSQPSAGAFGRRPKKIAKRRKGGF
ncbi:hypothetical protein F5Y16DRAFT_362128 [Xylariaceae sp. FL0255]|nr:hypothetical protein F5Y16DRAFT_362128 [Xylariaceae sp. FL0255]